MSLLAVSAHAGLPFDQLIVFGASYEDVGQFPDYDFVAATFPSLVAPPGAGLDGSTGIRMTNIDPATGRRGQVWVEMLADSIGTGSLVPSTPLLYPGARTDIPDTDNVDFAFVTARSADLLDAVTGTSRVAHPTDDLVAADLTASSPGFLQRLQAGSLKIGPNTLFVINPAGNDVRDSAVEDPTATATVGAANTLEIIRQLVGAGARTIVVPTFPPLGLLPESTNLNPDGSRTAKAEARAIGAATYNALMAEGLPGVGGNIVVGDFDTLLREVLAAPAAFGFGAGIDQSRYCYSASEWSVSAIDCTEAPGLGKSSGGTPDDFITNDGLHPTQALAHIFADYTESVLRAPGFAALLPEAVLADARGHLNTVQDQLAQNRWGDRAFERQLFVAVQGRRLDTADTRATPEASSDAADLTLGGSVGLGGGWFAGGALGSQQGDADIDNSSFESSGLIGSLFAGYRCEGWFADVVLSAGKTDLDDIERVFEVGTWQMRRESGDTEADVLGLSGTLGVDMMGEGSVWRFGPFLAADYLDIEVDGYEEKSANSTAMAFGDLARESVAGSAGVFASYPFRIGAADLELRGDVAWVEEFEDRSDDVRAVVKRVADGVWFRMPGYDIDDGGVRAVLGVDAGWRSGLRLGLSYRYADNEAEAQYLNLSASYAF
jgi:outer membrane lipase/esterase